MIPLLNEPPDGLAFEEVRLFFVGIIPGDDERGFVPSYHHRILVEGADVGFINFRVGNTEFVWKSAGHIGYEIKSVYRGAGFAGKACRALAPLVARHYHDIILTTDPHNRPSIRTIEKLGATYLDQITVLLESADPFPVSSIRRRNRWQPQTVINPVCRGARNIN